MFYTSKKKNTFLRHFVALSGLHTPGSRDFGFHVHCLCRDYFDNAQVAPDEARSVWVNVLLLLRTVVYKRDHNCDKCLT